jgi:hypothetical protein
MPDDLSEDRDSQKKLILDNSREISRQLIGKILMGNRSK